MKQASARRTSQQDLAKRYMLIGWREVIGLPDLGISAMKAKIDTGARTSALHASDIVTIERDDAHWVEFLVPLPGVAPKRRLQAQLVERRRIKNTSGVPDERHVVRTRLQLGGQSWVIEVSLADRERMEFGLILGRTAIRNRRILVNPGKSFLAGAPAAPAVEA